jgi:cold shock CspA family protein
MSAGSLKMWNVERGFGFIQDDAGGPDMFLHITALQDAGIFSGQPQARRSICLRNQQHSRWKDESQQCSEGVTPEPT